MSDIAMKKQPFLRIMAVILIGLLALLSSVLGFILLLDGEIITLSFAITFVLLPGALLAGSIFTIYSNRRRIIKILVCLSLVFSFVFLSFSLLMFGQYENRKITTGQAVLAEYVTIINHIPESPQLSSLDHPEEMEHQTYYNQSFVLFESTSDTFIFKYSTTAYAAQKERLETLCIFQEGTTTIDGYAFRFLSSSKEVYPSLDYPKRIMLIATNDTTQEIVYLYFVDDDLDYISDVNDFILNDCGWKYLR